MFKTILNLFFAINISIIVSNSNWHKLLIFPSETVIYESDPKIQLNIKFVNCYKDEVAIFKYSDVTSGDMAGAYFWRLEIMYEEGIIMRFSENYYSPQYGLSKNIYELLNKGDSLCFSINIDFSKLYNPEEISRHDVIFGDYKNKNYGKYYLRLYYQDYWRGHKKSYKNILKSNIVIITYKQGK